MRSRMAPRRTAIVTGANHGIGAATARALARSGCAVLCTFLRTYDPDDPGTPEAYRDHRAGDATGGIDRIRADGGEAAADGPGTPEAYRGQRAGDGREVIAGIRADGGEGAAEEAALSEPATPARLF